MARRRRRPRELSGVEAEEEAFLRAIAQAPGEAAPRLIYADWLDERGDEASARRAGFLRVECELREAGYGTRRRERLRQDMQQRAGEVDVAWLGRVRRPRVRDWPGRPTRSAPAGELYLRRVDPDPAPQAGAVGCLVGLAAAVAAGLFLGSIAETVLGFIGIAFAACCGLIVAAACRRSVRGGSHRGGLAVAALLVGGAVLAAVNRPTGVAWWFMAWVFGPFVVAIVVGCLAALRGRRREARG